MVKRMDNIWNINNTCIVGSPDGNPPVLAVAAIQITEATFKINNAKLYVAVVTLSIENTKKI